jgi:hypothetical protein
MTGRADATRVLALHECAEVLPGFSIAGRLEHDPKGTHQVVITRHLTDGVPYIYNPSHELRIVPRRDTTPYEVHAGDVLFMSRGTQNRAWVVERVPTNPTIAPVSFYILRPGDGLDGGYLAWYVNQAPAQGAIGQLRTGAGTPIVQRDGFQSLKVLVPPLDVQREIAALGVLLARERDLRQRLADVTGRAHAALGANIIETLRDHHA